MSDNTPKPQQRPTQDEYDKLLAACETALEALGNVPWYDYVGDEHKSREHAESVLRAAVRKARK